MYKLYRDSLPKLELNLRLPVFVDTETCEDVGISKGGLYGRVRLVQIYQEGWSEAVIIDCYFIPLHEVLRMLYPYRLVFHNAAYDLHTINLKTSATWLPKEVDDTLHLSRIAFPTKVKFTFYDCLKHAGLEDDTIRSIDKKEEQKADWSGPLSEKQLLYASCDVIYLCKLYNVVKGSTDSIVYRLDIDNLKYAVEYARRGLYTNQDTVKQLKLKYTNLLERVLSKLPVNPRSAKQVGTYLGIKSTAKEVLQVMSFDGNEKAENVLNARHYYKCLEFLRSYDRPIVKGFFTPSTALAGRFSCKGGDSYGHANLQQIPEELQHVFEAPEGYVYIYKDYAGIELRMAVAYTGEPYMAELMLSGADMHTETAKYLFNVDNPTPLQRAIAKTFNFGLIYGAGVKRVMGELRARANVIMTFQEVKELIAKWFSLYVYFEEWHNAFKSNMNIYGYLDVETALGRKVRAFELTDALNIPIQGSSAEVIKVALGLLKKRWEGANLVNTIHDANVLLHKVEEAELWGKRMDECMVDAWEYVIKDFHIPELPMPYGFKVSKVWNFG